MRPAAVTASPDAFAQSTLAASASASSSSTQAPSPAFQQQSQGPPLNSLLVTLVRHGESQDNLKSIWAGVRDSPLSTTGQSQAKAVGQAFSNVPIAAIYCSDLKRAATTADEILKQNLTQPPPTLVQSQSLREQNFGQAEGKSWSSAEWHTLPTGEDARTARFQDGESLEDVNARMATAVRRFVLPRVEALRKEPASSQANDAASLVVATGGNVPADVPHIVIVAHGIAIAELLRVFMSLHDSDPPAMKAPWEDPRQTYRRVRLENTGWTRLQISVPAAPNGTASRPEHPLPRPAQVPSGTGIVSNTALTSGLDGGQMQTIMVEGPADAQKQPPSSPSAGRNIFVRILIQNNIDHLKGFVLQAPTKGPATLLGGGAPGHDRVGSGDSSGGNRGLTPSNTSHSLAHNPTTPLLQSGSATTFSMNKSPNALLATPASAKSLNAYDSRFLAREMEKATSGAALQSIAGFEHVGNSSMSLATSQSNSTVSSSSLNPYSLQNTLSQLPPAGSDISGSAISGLGPISDAWQSICIKVLPLFNGEGLKTSFDELNSLVSSHVRKAIERGPARAVDSLHADIVQVTSMGMYTLNSRLSALQGEALLRQLVAVWTEYFCNVMPNLEAALLPMQTDPDLISLTQNKANRPPQSATQSTFGLGSPTDGSSAIPQGGTGPSPGTSSLRKERIDVRKTLLTVFRDEVIFPRYEPLFYLFAHIRNFHASANDEQGQNDMEASDNALYPRLLQMTCVTASILSNDATQHAIDSLLRALRIGYKGGSEAELESLGWSAVSGPSTQSMQKANRRGWLPRLTLQHSNFTTPMPSQASTRRPTLVPPVVHGEGAPSADEEEGLPAGLAAIPPQDLEEVNPYLESDDFLQELKSGGSNDGGTAAGGSSHPYGQASTTNGKRLDKDGRPIVRPPSTYAPGFSQEEFLNSLRSPAISESHSTPQSRTPDADRTNRQPNGTGASSALSLNTGDAIDLSKLSILVPQSPDERANAYHAGDSNRNSADNSAEGDGVQRNRPDQGTAGSAAGYVSPKSFMDFVYTPVQSAPPTGKRLPEDSGSASSDAGKADDSHDSSAQGTSKKSSSEALEPVGIASPQGSGAVVAETAATKALISTPSSSLSSIVTKLNDAATTPISASETESPRGEGGTSSAFPLSPPPALPARSSSRPSIHTQRSDSAATSPIATVAASPSTPASASAAASAAPDRSQS